MFSPSHRLTIQHLIFISNAFFHVRVCSILRHSHSSLGFQVVLNAVYPLLKKGWKEDAWELRADPRCRRSSEEEMANHTSTLARGILEESMMAPVHGHKELVVTGHTLHCDSSLNPLCLLCLGKGLQKYHRFLKISA